jgi:hypothetical protein
VRALNDNLLASDIDVVSVLKGETNWGSVPIPPPAMGSGNLVSQYWPRQNEYYLVFAIFHDGEYQATEPYRVVPLGIRFSTNLLAGKSLDQQIKFCLQWRLDNLNRDLGQMQEEKKRLESGLKN